MTVAAHARRGFLQTAKATTLNGEHNDSQTTIHGSDLSTWSGATSNGPGTYTIARGKTDEETGTFAATSSNDLTGVVRPANAQSHSSGASLELTSSKVDFDEANELVSNMAHNGVRVTNSAAITLTSGVETPLTFNTERWDVGGLHSTSANTSRLTAVVAGKYLITANVYWAANITGLRQLKLQLNGATGIAVTGIPPSAGAYGLGHEIWTVYDLAAGNYVELLAYQDSGGDLNITQQTAFSPEFGMQWIGF